MKQKADYKNWIPKGMIYGVAAATVICAVLTAVFTILAANGSQSWQTVFAVVFAVALLACGKYTQWCVHAYNTFSYDGKRQLSKQMIEGIADYVQIPDGGIGLDVGCGSGALTIASAKRNPKANFIGIDRWGKEYASFNLPLCECNAKAEGVSNVSFQKGDAARLDFPDESFDAVTSNYVYHNIPGADKQKLLLETLRVLKKGGSFAIHDLMSKRRYGDMEAFVKTLRDMGYEEVMLIDTTNGRFMTKRESKQLMLGGSTLLVGKK